jgi:hypothetical protein
MLLPTPSESVIYRSLSDGAVLFSLADEVYFGLNAVAAEVWELLPPAHTTLESLVAALIVRHADVPAAKLREDVIELLESLQSFGLLVPASALACHEPRRVATVQARLA